MKIDLHQGIRNYDGKFILGEDGQPEPLRTFINNGLNGHVKDEIIPAEEKTKIYLLTIKIFAKWKVALTTDEMELIKKRVDKIYPPVILGRITDIFNDITREAPILEYVEEDEPKEDQSKVKAGKVKAAAAE